MHLVSSGSRLSAFASVAFASVAVALAATPASAQKKYDVGATDTEIKIGNIMPYSGPASAYASVGKAEAAYLGMINDQGGINGRKINFITYDDGYSPPKAVEQARKLVESDQVLLIFSPLGTASNSAIQKYMNAKKVPQLFAGSGATKWGDPRNFPWTIGLIPNYQSEGRIYAKYILEHHRDGKIAILYQNDDLGRDYLKGLKDGLGDTASAMIVAEASYETSDPTVDSQIVKLKASGADIFVDIATPKFAAQAIKKVAEIGWKPVHILDSVASSMGSVLKPAGFENAKGILSSDYRKDVTDPKMKNDPGVKAFLDFMDKYMPGSDSTDTGYVTGYLGAIALTRVLTQCGDDLTRENVMRQAANLKDFEIGVLQDGVKINTSPTDFFPIKQLRMRRFNGENWELFGPVILGEIAS